MPQSSGKKCILKIEVFEKPGGLRIEMFGSKSKFPYVDGKEVADYISYLYESRNGTEELDYKDTESKNSTYSA